MSEEENPHPPKGYHLIFTKNAQRDYEGLRDSKLKRGVNRILDKLKENPYQFKRLSGPLRHLYVAKTFSFRVIYHIEGNRLIVYVVSIEHRREAYR